MTFQQYPFKGGIPSGNTANRPGSPVIGDTYYNGQLGLLEIYDGTNWIPNSAPAGIPSFTATDAASSRTYTDGPAVNFAITPGTNGGAAYGYTVTATSAATATVYSATSSTTTPTLSLGTASGNYGASWTVTANAYNGFGTSPNSSSTALTVSTKPQAPTIGTATLGSATTDVTVTWTLGATGGKNLTGITITPYLNGTTAQTSRTAATTSSTSYVFTGASALTAGNSYTFKVKQTNQNGDSPESSATNSVSVPLFFNVDYLVVSGGGSGVGNIGGGGGGGGGFTSATTVSIATGTAYTLTVGGGGAQSYNDNGNAGTYSQFVTYSTGAGLGGNKISNNQGKGGTSGSPQSNTGGNGATGSYSERGGGGGGAGAAGQDAQSNNGGNGGNGLTNSITGTSTYYAGGGAGGGARDRVNGQGGLGGGGGGGSYGNFNSSMNGTANSGGGGGAGAATNGGNGGSGVVIFKIPDTRSATFSGGVTYTGGSASGGFKTYTITAAGTSDTVTFSQEKSWHIMQYQMRITL